MENKEDYLKFITSESYKQQIDVWYKAYNISHEKIDLFYDVLISIYELINDTYLGNDVVKTEEDQKNHFTWCWDKVIDDLSKEKIFLKNRGVHYEYFWGFFLEAFYYNKIQDKPILIPEYFKKLFDFNHKKTRAELDVLTDLYNLINQNLKK
jgi:hypothetical protein